MEQLIDEPLAFFFRQMGELVEQGHLFIARPPLYRVRRKKDERYLHSDAELRGALFDLGLEGASLEVAGGERVVEKEELRRLGYAE